MSPWIWTALGLAVLTLAALAWMILNPSANANDPTKLDDVVYTAENQHRLDTVRVTPAELAAATCREGAPCWIAVDGVVYDVSGYGSWARRGSHHGVPAGTDATEKFIGSAHGKEKLQQMPVVGRLAD